MEIKGTPMTTCGELDEAIKNAEANGKMQLDLIDLRLFLQVAEAGRISAIRFASAETFV
jgi:hypothetical protein